TGSASLSPRGHSSVHFPIPKHPFVRARIEPQIFQHDFPCPLHMQCATSFLRPFLLPRNDPPLCVPAHTRPSPITSAQLPQSLCCSLSAAAVAPAPPSNADGCSPRR